MANVQTKAPKTRDADGWVRRGMRHDKAGRERKAMKCYLAAFNEDPTHTDALKRLSDKLVRLTERRMAIEVLERAVAANPNDPDVYLILGNLALEMNMLDQAIKLFKIVTTLIPGEPVGYNNIATVMREQERLDEAIAYLQDILPMFPENAALWNTLGTIVSGRDGLEAALPFYEESLRLNPKMGKTLSNLARGYEVAGRFEEAVDMGKRAVKADPEATEPHVVMGTAYLSLGELERGWEEYEWRQHYRRPEATRFVLDAPRWQGQDLTDKTVVICPEQGIGDEILYASCIADILDQPAQCLIGCDPRLVPLYERSFPDATVGGYRDVFLNAARYRDLPFVRASGATPDYFIEIASLGKFFRKQLTNFPEPGDGYLSPDPERVAFWKERLDSLGPALKVGIAWRSGRQTTERNIHYTSLMDWTPIFSVPGVTFVNMQYGDCEDELKAAEDAFGITIHRWDDIDLKNDIDDATALTKAVDLMIGPTIAPANMALSVATELWLLARKRPHWSFGMPDRSPLGPSHFFLYDDAETGWDAPIEGVAAALRERAGVSN